MITSELRDMIYQFVDASIDVRELEEWLVPRLSFFMRFPESADADLVSALELGFAEMDAHIISPQEFRESLLDILHEDKAIKATYIHGDVQIESGSSNQTSKLVASYTGQYQAHWAS